MLRDRDPVESISVGKPELLKRRRHRAHRHVGRAIIVGQRPNTLRRLPHVTRGAEERGFHRYRNPAASRAATAPASITRDTVPPPGNLLLSLARNAQALQVWHGSNDFTRTASLAVEFDRQDQRLTPKLAQENAGRSPQRKQLP